MNYQQERMLMLEAARAAGTVLMRYFRQEIVHQEKGPLDLVTEADFASERLILDRIRDRFPGDAITAEESGAAGEASRRWYIDPLDGTISFAHGLPFFAVTIAFWDATGPQAAVVYNPVGQECYTATRGEGAFLNGLPIRCSSTDRPEDSLLFINPHGLRWSGVAEPLLDVYRRFGRKVQGIINLGSMSLGICAVAVGRLDGAVALDVDQFSTPASSLILQEAGGLITDVEGELYHPASGSLIAASPTLHSKLMAILSD